MLGIDNASVSQVSAWSDSELGSEADFKDTSPVQRVHDYDDLRVQLIVLNSAPDKDVDAIQEVLDRIAWMREGRG